MTVVRWIAYDHDEQLIAIGEQKTAATEGTVAAEIFTLYPQAKGVAVKTRLALLKH